MGLFNWLKPRTQRAGPTQRGLYGELPKGARWVGGADPVGDPEDFIPEAKAYVFDIAEWRWDKQLWIEAKTNSAGNLAGSVWFSDYPMAKIRIPLRFGSAREVEARP